MTALAYSPTCHVDAAKGAHRHRCSAEHADVVATYRAELYAWEITAEAATNGWAAELVEYKHEHPCPQFRDHLIARSRCA